MVFGITFEGKVIKLEDMVLRGGIAIALSDVAIVSAVDALDELIEADRLSTIIAS